jgi:uncharacterized protein (TIRG00374 family)
VVRALWFASAFVALHVLAPALIATFRAWPQLLRISPFWFPLVVGTEFASFACIWTLQKLALDAPDWFGVATSQLAGNAVSRLVPGGAAAGAAVQLRLLSRSGVDPASAGTALAATTLIDTAVLSALPLLALPAIAAGLQVPSDLARAALFGVIAFAFLFTIGWVLVTTERPLRLLGRSIDWIFDRLKRPDADAPLSERLVQRRDQIMRIVERRWRIALLAAAGASLFDYLSLLCALTAVGARARPSLVLLAYVAAAFLAMIPITPGGLGFVEAGLTALLVVAGVSAAQSVIATLAYRLASYWLPMPAGLIATWLNRRHYERRRRLATSDRG